MIVLLNPVAPTELAVEASDQALLDSAMSGYIAGVGLVFLATSSPSAVCSSLQSAGNSTLGFGGVVGGVSCGLDSPSPPLSSASLTLPLPGRTLEIQAWLARP